MTLSILPALMLLHSASSGSYATVRAPAAYSCRVTQVTITNGVYYEKENGSLVYGEHLWWGSNGNSGLPIVYRTDRACMVFHLAALPPGVQIVAASIHYNQFYGDSISLLVRVIPTASSMAETLYRSIEQAPNASPYMNSNTGWNEIPLTQWGLRALDSCNQKQGWIAFGTQHSSSHGSDTAHGYRAHDSLRPYMVINFIGSYADAATSAVLAPIGSVDSATTVIPSAIVENKSDAEKTLPVRFWIGDRYQCDTSVTLPAGWADTVSFRSWTANDLGEFWVRCSTMLDGDGRPSNDCKSALVRVSAGGGVAETPDGRTRLQLALTPNPARGQARVHLGFSCTGTLAVHDVTGREVWSVRVKRGTTMLTLPLLRAGVYLVRLESDRLSTTEKLVIQE